MRGRPRSDWVRGLARCTVTGGQLTRLSVGGVGGGYGELAEIAAALTHYTALAELSLPSHNVSLRAHVSFLSGSPSTN